MLRCHRLPARLYAERHIMMFFPATSAAQLRLYLDESGTLGFGDEVFTMAMVLVSDLVKLEGCIARNKTTQAEIKASQMKTAQKLALAKTILEHNDLEIYLLTIDPAAANACERKLDKELLYDSMIAQAMAYYLERDELPRGGAYRLSLDMRGGIRESFEDMVCESIGNVLMHREEPLVSDLQIRYMDSKYSAGVQVADLFSNIYRTALSLSDSPCNEFLRKGYADGIIHLGFSFGLPELANQMAQIANDLRAHVEYNAANNIASTFRMMPTGMEEGAVVFGSNGETQADKLVDAEPLAANDAGLDVADDGAADDAPDASTETDSPAADIEETSDDNTEQPRALSRSARRRRSRAARKAADAKEAAVHKAQTNDLVDAVQVDDSANESPMDGAVDTARADASATTAQTDGSTAGAAQTDGTVAATPVDASIESSAQVNTSTKSGQKQEANTVAEASALTSEADVEPATEPVVITARERRQKAAKKIAHSPAKSKQGQPATSQKSDATKSKAESEPVLTDNASSDAPKQADEPATAIANASTGKPQSSIAADQQPTPVAESSLANKADAPVKPKRTRTRSRSKAKEAPAEVKAEASQGGAEKDDPSQTNAVHADLARADVAHVDSAQASASSKADPSSATAAKPSPVKHTDKQAKTTKTTASADSSSAETGSVKAAPATHDGGADNPTPAKPRARRTRTRKTSGPDAQAQSE